MQLVLCCVVLHPSGDKREVATIYEIVQDANGAAYALPDYQFTCEGHAQACRCWPLHGSAAVRHHGSKKMHVGHPKACMLVTQAPVI